MKDMMQQMMKQKQSGEGSTEGMGGMMGMMKMMEQCSKMVGCCQTEKPGETTEDQKK